MVAVTMLLELNAFMIMNALEVRVILEYWSQGDGQSGVCVFC